ncbi:MAG: uracil-DNA glycosylase [Hydrogenimonas sp.]|nr:uracil-DNA glycosylase [Hydrogenimonas sp.]
MRNMLNVHSEWRADVAAALAALDSEYMEFLKKGGYIPKPESVFSAFKTLPKSELKYILFGQDPYPRAESATGHAFIDGAVKNIFSSNGLDKRVNRATSLRNFIKMALVASNLLDGNDLSQEAISRVDKSSLIETIDELRSNFESNGVLLLNAALVFEDKRLSSYHAKAWRPFLRTILLRIEGNVELILFGNIAKDIAKIPEAARFKKIEIEHPYNHSFVLNERAHNLFGTMKLLFKYYE